VVAAAASVAAVVTVFSAESVTVGLAVSDLVGAAAWYGRLLGREVDLSPADGVAEFRIVAGCWLQLYEGTGGGEGAFRFGVADIEGARSRLLELGVAVSPVEEVPGVIAYCEFTDPYGNRLSLYQELA
jgi:predicted enzyme related to lactoylglutathione lyase